MLKLMNLNQSWMKNITFTRRLYYTTLDQAKEEVYKDRNDTENDQENVTFYIIRKMFRW